VSAALDAKRLREDFPILHQTVRGGRPLVYLDNAATTQKPRAVIDAVSRYYERDNANVHRAVHLLSQLSTQEFEEARVKVQRLLNASVAREVVFTRGATEAINLVAQSYGRQNVGAGDEVVVSHMEHHSNIVPWQMLCQERGAHLRVIPVDDRGELILEEYEKLLGPRTRLVAVVHASNSLGTVNPVRTIIEAAHKRGIPVLLDGAQAVAHFPVDVQELGCDFYVFSGHKIYGPTGIGVLYGKQAILSAMPPYQGGGDMIASVTFSGTTYADLPNKFEAGTPDIAGAVGLGAALDYLASVGLESAAKHEDRLLRHATERLCEIPGVRIVGTARHKIGVLSFVVDNPPVSSLDVGTQLDLEGIAVRTGHHCCQPVMDRFGIPGTARISLALYNTVEEVEAVAAVLRGVVTRAAARARAAAPAATAAAAVEPVYAKTYGPSPQATADKLAAAFDFMDSWQDRYQYIIELGKKLPAMPAAMKTEENRVRGCQSTVFLSARRRPGTEDVMEFLADSDADIVRGLLTVLQRLFSGHRAGDVAGFDVEGFFHRLGLDQHLTMGRRNGLTAMVQRIRAFAQKLAGSASGAVAETPAGAAAPVK